MRTLTITAVLLATAGLASAANVTMVKTAGVSPGVDQYDFILDLVAADGEYNCHEIDVLMGTASIQDPDQDQVWGEGAPSPAADTFFDTINSHYGGGAGSVIYNDYKPVGIGSDPQPTQHLYWTVYDTATGDDYADTPVRIARILVAQGDVGTGHVLVGTHAGITGFDFIIPEPATMGLLAIGGLGLLLRRRR